MPLLAPSVPSDNVYQTKEYGYFDQWYDSRCQPLVTMDAECRNSNGNCQSEIVNRSSEARRACQFVPKPELPRHPHCRKKTIAKYTTSSAETRTTEMI
jgi:hypothetical protein